MDMEDSTVISVTPDRNISRGESSRQGGRHRAITSSINTTTRWPTPDEAIGMTISEATEETVRANEKAFLSTWDHKIFIVSCAFAALVDPLFLYTYFLEDRGKCFTWDEKKKHDLRMLYLRIYIALPIAQIMRIFGLYLLPLYPLLPFLPVQYMLRVYRIYRTLRLRPNIETGMGRWLKAILDFFPFVLAAHLFGALWYILAVYRELDCWKYSCQNKLMCGNIFLFNTCLYFNESEGDITVVDMINKSCSANSTIFDFGIYLYAIQSEMTRSTDVPRKILQGFWWGLQNLSSFGSNLRTTISFAKNHTTIFYSVEICFSIALCFSGIALFLIYLNERVQVSKKRSKERKLRRKMQMLNPEIDLWLSKNSLPKSLKTGIMENVRKKLEENNYISADSTILSILPIRYRKDIMSQIRLASVKKVPAFENMDERVLKAICEHLKPVIYAEDKYIIREGEPLEKMLFITQGTAWSYTSISNNSISTSCSSVIKCLEKGDFFGEEILEWATKLKSFSDFPVSTRVVKSQTKVEAFAIRANDLRNVVCKFWWHFSSTEQNDPHSQQWQHLAASSIQVKWRLLHPRPAGST